MSDLTTDFLPQLLANWGMRLKGSEMLGPADLGIACSYPVLLIDMTRLVMQKLSTKRKGHEWHHPWHNIQL